MKDTFQINIVHTVSVTKTV